MTGIIPEKYHNSTDLANISSVVLSGTNPTNNPDIFNIGINIVKTISKNFRAPMQVINMGSGAGTPTNPADNAKTNQTIVVDKVDQ